MIVIRLPFDSPPIRSNQRLHWGAKAKLTKSVRTVTGLCAKQWNSEWPKWGENYLPLTGPVSVTIVWEVTDRRRRDVGASTPTLKAALDGLVDAGILISDDHNVVREERYRIEVGARKGVRVEIDTIPTQQDAPSRPLAAPLTHQRVSDEENGRWNGRRAVTRTLARKLACPTPRKRYYTSQLRACVVLAKILAHPETVIPGVRPPCRAYHCRCGFWHLTSRTYNAADELARLTDEMGLYRTDQEAS